MKDKEFEELSSLLKVLGFDGIDEEQFNRCVLLAEEELKIAKIYCITQEYCILQGEYLLAKKVMYRYKKELKKLL